MRFLCNHCDQKIHANHYWTGMSVTCPGCGKVTELGYRLDQPIPYTEFNVKFSDFKHLILDGVYSEGIHPLVEELLGCSVQRTETGIVLAAEDGSLIPLEVAHLEIQMNTVSRGKLYSAAMNLWR